MTPSGSEDMELNCLRQKYMIYNSQVAALISDSTSHQITLIFVLFSEELILK